MQPPQPEPALIHFFTASAVSAPSVTALQIVPLLMLSQLHIIASSGKPSTPAPISSPPLEPTALKVFVGKRYGCHALSQQEINDKIIKYVFSHGHVVRLKGGDPFVFGRAQEEIDAARKFGIEVEVIPGISSALAVPASQMIPLTCRGLNESFWVTTGTTKSGTISSDVNLAAQSSATVVILMAMSKLEEIMDIFVGHGKSETPVAIIQDGTTEKEKFVIGTVKDIFFRAQYAGISNPAIIIVGEVVSLHPSLRNVISNVAVQQKEAH